MKNIQSKPGKEFRPWALWIWNDSISPEEMVKQLTQFSEKGFGGVAIRPSHGMRPAYLSEEFLALFGSALAIAKNHNLGIRLADDLAVPSSPNMQLLLEQNKQLRAITLQLVSQESVAEKTTVEKSFDTPADYFVFCAKLQQNKIIGSSVKQITIPQNKNTLSWQAPAGSEWSLIILKKSAVRSPNGFLLPNLFNARSAQSYIKYVLEPLRTAFSKFVPSIFEGFISELPAIVPSSQGIPWDDDLISKYRSKYKKDLLRLLPTLFVETSETDVKNRPHLYAYIASVYYERSVASLDSWAKKLRWSQWVLCAEKSLYAADSISHDCFMIPDVPLTMVGMQNQDGQEENSALLKAVNDINVLEMHRDTIAVLGRNRSGSGLSLQELKSEIETAATNGASRLLIDGFYFNLSHRNFIRTPANPFWYSDAWQGMGSLCEHAARLLLLTHGLHAQKPVAVLLPTQSMHAAFLPSQPDKAGQAHSSLKKVCQVLDQNKIPFDIITEKRLLACTIKANGEFGLTDKNRKGSYQAVVIPYAAMVSKSLFVFLEKLGIKKGKALILDDAPVGNLDDGVSATFTDRIEKLLHAKKDHIQVLGYKDLTTSLAHVSRTFDVQLNGKPCPDIEGYQGIASDHHLYIFHNTNETKDFFATLTLPSASHLALVDTCTGELHEIKNHIVTPEGIETTLMFAPQQTYVLITSNTKLQVVPAKKGAEHPVNVFGSIARSYRIVLKDQWNFAPETFNTLPLANWSTRIGLSRETGNFTHFSESYFEVKEVPDDCILLLCMAFNSVDPIDRLTPAEIEVSINGVTVEPSPDAGNLLSNLWSANGFCGNSTTRYSIKDFLIRGYNRIAVRSLGTTVEPVPMVYPPVIAGTFSISKGQKGWTIDSPEALTGYDSWTRHGFPYYSGFGIYTQKFELPTEKSRVILSFSNVSGMIDVKINEKPVGTHFWQPMDIDITGLCEHKRNDLTIRILNTMDNLVRMSSKPSGLLGEVYLDVYEE